MNNNIDLMMKLLVFGIFLVCGVVADYNKTTAKNLIYACASTFGTEA